MIVGSFIFVESDRVFFDFEGGKRIEFVGCYFKVLGIWVSFCRFRFWCWFVKDKIRDILG